MPALNDRLHQAIHACLHAWCATATHSLPRRAWVGVSGGLDSTVLLHALSQHPDWPASVQRVVSHVHHGLHPDAETWLEHCATLAKDLGFVCLPFHATVEAGSNLEDRARRARLAHWKACLQPQDSLWLGHHQHDQAETLLLRLMRGAGGRGLQGMATCSNHAGFTTLRPLLGFSRDELTTYARDHGLNWVHDPSNEDLSLDRNHLRHRVFPTLRHRWPHAHRAMARSMAHLRSQHDALTWHSEQLLSGCSAPPHPVVPHATRLSLSGWATRPTHVNLTLLQVWLNNLTGQPPSSTWLHQAMIILQRPDRPSTLLPSHGHWHVGVHRGKLWLFEVPNLPPPPSVIVEPGDTLQRPEPWASVTLPKADQLAPWGWQGDDQLTVRVRQGGERLWRAQHHTRLKHHLQDLGIPAWLRHSVPLLFSNDRLLAVLTPHQP